MSKYYYVSRITSHLNENKSIFDTVCTANHGKTLTLEEIESLSRDDLRNLYLAIDQAISLSRSPYSVEKIANAILNARSGIGGSAMTPYICNFCGKQDIWVNTAVPKICKACATDIATNIVLNGSTLTK